MSASSSVRLSSGVSRNMAQKKVVEPVSDKLAWAEPPSKSHGRPPRPGSVEMAEDLRKNPERWAIVASGEKSNHFAQMINRNGGAFREGRWEATSRTTPDGMDIYARYLGE